MAPRHHVKMAVRINQMQEYIECEILFYIEHNIGAHEHHCGYVIGRAVGLGAGGVL